MNLLLFAFILIIHPVTKRDAKITNAQMHRAIRDVRKQDSQTRRELRWINKHYTKPLDK